jgi:hypothetical protein
VGIGPLGRPPLDGARRVVHRTALQCEISLDAAELQKVLGRALVVVNACSGN